MTQTDGSQRPLAPRGAVVRAWFGIDPETMTSSELKA